MVLQNQHCLTHGVRLNPDDKFHEECGVAAIYGHPEASKLAYLSLYALQHRGQESAGIATSDGTDDSSTKSMGHVADIFTNDVLKELPGSLAIGHTRYSTAGDTVERNAQPFSVQCNKGRIAVAHNGNITNATELRAELEATTGPSFRLRAIPKSSCTLWRTPASAICATRCAMLCCNWKVRFRWYFWLRTGSLWLATLAASGRWPWGNWMTNGHKAYVFASETCAFDLINAVYLNDVQPGEMVIVGPEGITRERYAPEQPRCSACSSTFIFHVPIRSFSAGPCRILGN